ncbi:MAG: alpha-L-fucosidase [Anaerolineae bacterium]|nr:alpha-L-fucosidase [Anaerolineae bacterium]
MSNPTTPNLPVPSPRQLNWHSLELYGFVHFTVNTFTDKEWGYGDESPAVFNPTAFDADQIVSTARDGGLKGLILTCKHHDGFCLWPSAYTEHSIKHSPWRGGKGDMVAEFSAACARHGLKFGVYLSPWDRNHPAYGSPAYIAYYRNQLRELLTGYGPLFEIWFDGANGGDGYYGGAREDRRIDKLNYYDWEPTWQMVRELQPDACIFSDVGPDIRWVGNENGIAGDPCWATLNPAGLGPGMENPALNNGERAGAQWLPAECDVSIRPGWFYHATEDHQVKTPDQLVDLYYQSVGRGASFLINLPPDRRGLVHEADAASLREFSARIQRTFQTDLARTALADCAGENAAAVCDGDARTWFDLPQRQGEITLSFASPVELDVVSLREHLPSGQRIDAFALDAWLEGGWVEQAAATSVGSRRLLRLPAIRTTRLRLRILQAAAPPAIQEIAVYRS